MTWRRTTSSPARSTSGSRQRWPPPWPPRPGPRESPAPDRPSGATHLPPGRGHSSPRAALATPGGTTRRRAPAARARPSITRAALATPGGTTRRWAPAARARPSITRAARVLRMFAVTAARFNAEDPLAGLELGERPDPTPPDGWTTVTVKATSLNHHDVWSLRGVGLAEDRLPMILGCDAAGLDENGNPVVVYGVVGDATGGDETLDPKRSLLSERYNGTFAEKVAVPRRNLLPKPDALSFEEAACLPTAYLTAYRMLFGAAGAEPGATILVQGAGGGVATALILLGRAGGYRIWVTSRSEAKRDRAVKLGAGQAFPTGERLPERVDAVM